MGGDGRSVNQENRTQEKGDGERLQKVLAQAGVASRRHSEQLIVEGRVTVNGNKVTVLGTKVSISDRIQVDGHPVYRSVELHYYLLNKPVSVITSASDPQGRPTVVDLMKDVSVRVYPCLLYTSDAADEEDSVDLGGRRIIKKK